MKLQEKVALLAERCQVGDTDALEELIRCTKMAIIHRAHLPPESGLVAASDILQETYWQFWRSRLTVFAPAALSWLVKVARSRLIDARRAATAQKRGACAVPLDPLIQASEGSGLRRNNEALIDPKARVEDTVLERERARMILRAVRHLPVPYQRVIAGYACGEKLLATAARYGMPEGTVKSRRNFGLKRLRAFLEPIREAL